MLYFKNTDKHTTTHKDTSMRLYYLLELIRGMDADIVTYYQKDGGWYCIVKDRFDGQEYEMVIHPRKSPCDSGPQSQDTCLQRKPQVSGVE